MKSKAIPIQLVKGPDYFQAGFCIPWLALSILFSLGCTPQGGFRATEVEQTLRIPEVVRNPSAIATEKVLIEPSELATNVLSFHRDHLGNASTVTNGNGVVLQRSLLGPYGEIKKLTNAQGVVIAASASATPLMFTGHYYDWESGYHYANARYIDPTTKRFTSLDPALYGREPGATFGMLVSSVQATNPYAYVENRTTRMVDPSGGASIEWVETLRGNPNFGGIRRIADGAKTGRNGSSILGETFYLKSSGFVRAEVYELNIKAAALDLGVPELDLFKNTSAHECRHCFQYLSSDWSNTIARRTGADPANVLKSILKMEADAFSYGSPLHATNGVPAGQYVKRFGDQMVELNLDSYIAKAFGKKLPQLGLAFIGGAFGVLASGVAEAADASATGCATTTSCDAQSTVGEDIYNFLGTILQRMGEGYGDDRAGFPISSTLGPAAPAPTPKPAWQQHGFKSERAYDRAVNSAERAMKDAGWKGDWDCSKVITCTPSN